jgi:hypothetical protein
LHARYSTPAECRCASASKHCAVRRAASNSELRVGAAARREAERGEGSGHSDGVKGRERFKNGR